MSGKKEKSGNPDPGLLPPLNTKFCIPPARPNIVQRTRLVQRIETGIASNHKLTLISAPAGFGKTTLISDWGNETRIPVAWVSLDGGDNDLTRFLGYCIAALQTIKPNIGGGSLEKFWTTNHRRRCLAAQPLAGTRPGGQIYWNVGGVEFGVQGRCEFQNPSAISTTSRITSVLPFSVPSLPLTPMLLTSRSISHPNEPIPPKVKKAAARVGPRKGMRIRYPHPLRKRGG